ncbi:MAG: site-2 protease family protein [Anaerolineales bacterium]|nr:site-2 protease family protein [Anaerolineales bacterium]
MGNSIRLFSVKGIDIKVHITFPLILVWSAVQFGLLSGRGLEGAIFGVVVTLILFVIVVLHELGHSIAALRYGVPVKQIVLLPIGGVAQLSRMPEKPIEEFVIAIAGPLVNFGLAIVLAVLAVVLGLEIGIGNMPLTFSRLARASLQSVFAYVFISNLFLGLFNLIPAFPMDGGRVFRSLLATRINYARATRIAVTVGQGIAWLMALWGLLGGGLFIIVIAVFILIGASQEGQLVQLKSLFDGLKVEQAFSRGVKSLTPNSTLREAVEITLSTFQSDFPVCEDDQLVGLLTQSRLIDSLNRLSPETFVGQVMEVDVSPVEPKDGLFQVQQRLAELSLDALPVVDQGIFLGLITSRDLNEAYRLLSKRPDLLAGLT